jgi:hypothetical protein
MQQGRKKRKGNFYKDIDIDLLSSKIAPPFLHGVTDAVHVAGVRRALG